MKIEDLIIIRYGVKKQIEQLIKHRQELDNQIQILKDEEKTNKKDGSESETD